VPSVGKLADRNEKYKSPDDVRREAYEREVAQIRLENSIPPADEDPSVVVAAVFDWTGRRISRGISGRRGAPMTPMNNPDTKKSTMNAISRTHAEGRALMSISGSVKGHHLALSVDKRPCWACQTMLKSYALNVLGVASLEVTGPNFHKIYTR